MPFFFLRAFALNLFLRSRGQTTMRVPLLDLTLQYRQVAADIQRVMKQYFKDHNRVVIYYNQAKPAEDKSNENQ